MGVLKEIYIAITMLKNVKNHIFIEFTYFTQSYVEITQSCTEILFILIYRGNLTKLQNLS